MNYKVFYSNSQDNVMRAYESKLWQTYLKHDLPELSKLNIGDYAVIIPTNVPDSGEFVIGKISSIHELRGVNEPSRPETRYDNVVKRVVNIGKDQRLPNDFKWDHDIDTEPDDLGRPTGNHKYITELRFSKTWVFPITRLSNDVRRGNHKGYRTTSKVSNSQIPVSDNPIVINGDQLNENIKLNFFGMF